MGCRTDNTWFVFKQDLFSSKIRQRKETDRGDKETKGRDQVSEGGKQQKINGLNHQSIGMVGSFQYFCSLHKFFEENNYRTTH